MSVDRVRIKVVSKDDPNAEGRWVDTDESFYLLPISFSSAASVLTRHVPDGHFIVAYARIAS